MKFFEETILRLLNQRTGTFGSGGAPAQVGGDSGQTAGDTEQAAGGEETAALQSLEAKPEIVSFDRGIDLDEIEEKSEYRLRRAVRSLDES